MNKTNTLPIKWSLDQVEFRECILNGLQIMTKCIDEKLSTQFILNIIKSILKFIKLNDDLLESHLIHYIPYIIINLITKKIENNLDIDIIIEYKLKKLLKLCIDKNKSTLNYIANMIDNKILDKSHDWFNNVDQIKKKQIVFENLVNASGSDDFIDQIQGTFIINVGFIQLSNGENIICDLYVMESLLSTKSENPYTRENYSVNDFVKYQKSLQTEINLHEEKRKIFILKNKYN